MRVYLPASSTILRSLVDSGALDPPLTGFAVTPGLRAYYTDTDPDTEVDELEYAAMSEAARASLRLIDADPMAWRRRVVLAADVPDGVIDNRDDLDRGVISVNAPVPLVQIASVHVDDPDAEAQVGAAATAVIAADLGDESAQAALDDAEGNELSWYATQELAALLELG